MCAKDKPFPDTYEGCTTANEFSPFIVQMTVKVSQGPTMNGQQWFQVAGNVFQDLNQNEGVVFNQEIEVYSS